MALSLALMQEELLEVSTKRYHSRAPREFSRAPIKTPQMDSVLGTTPVTANGDSPVKAVTDNKPRWDTKLSALMKNCSPYL